MFDFMLYLKYTEKANAKAWTSDSSGQSPKRRLFDGTYRRQIILFDQIPIPSAHPTIRTGDLPQCERCEPFASVGLACPGVPHLKVIPLHERKTEIARRKNGPMHECFQMVYQKQSIIAVSENVKSV